MRDWFAEHYPDRLRRVFGLVTEARGGKDYDATWGKRRTGEGAYAELIAQRMRAARDRLGFSSERLRLRTDLFARPGSGAQLSLL